MDRVKRLFWIWLIVLAVLLPTGDSAVYAQDPAVTDYLLNRINALRASVGVPPYGFNAQLAAAAQRQSNDQAAMAYVTHTGADGSNVRQRVLAAGYPAGPGGVIASENIYGGFGGSEEAFNWWLNSGLHYRGMTSTRYNEIGIGVAVDGNGVNYYTLVFGARPAGASPVVEVPVETLPESPPTEAVPAVQPTQPPPVIHPTRVPPTRIPPSDTPSISATPTPTSTSWPTLDRRTPTTRPTLSPTALPTLTPTPSPTGEATPTRAAFVPTQLSLAASAAPTQLLAEGNPSSSLEPVILIAALCVMLVGGIVIGAGSWFWWQGRRS